MYRRVFLLLSLIFLIPALVMSQVIEPNKSRSGSIYSGIGFGNPANLNSSHTNGMGLSGVATPSSFAPSLSNPAHWALSELTQAQLTMGMTNYDATDAFSSATNSQFAFDNFQFVFPILRNQLGASISFSPVTRSDFARIEQESFQIIGSADPVDYASSSIGSGGVNRFEFGLGYRVNSNLTLGYAVSAHVMSITEEITTSFSDNQFQRGGQPSVITDEITGAGLGNRFGVFTRFSGLFGSRDRVELAATANLPVSINGDRSLRTFRIVNTQPRRVSLNDGLPSREGTVKLPLEINTGLTYYLNPYHNFSAEFQYQNWEDAEFSYNLTEQGYYKDRTKVGVGYQYHPFLNQQASGFFSNFRYSLGATYDNGFLSISDQDIETVMFHAGLTIPSQRSRSSIDLSFNYGVRGTESESLVKENIWGFKLSLNLAEFMFLRQRFQ
ncbi:hypothetical protein DYD21_01975 [Rhodohalobacter sp. SW132]|uniref:hypothetical protein n=1 Tax=Rhodohalobacter sp. SW132 TaxID=2293433 RepID=UPI000E2815AA|nr:hypothetical protein [Rhodohalobacter sp. SW132]REL38742.1 hypothetical protein DYD21_01975 [Rhodohalobacter sp. SW132]